MRFCFSILILFFSISSFANLSTANTKRIKDCSQYTQKYSSYFFKYGLFSNNPKPFISSPAFLQATLRIILEAPLINNFIWSDLTELSKMDLNADNVKNFSENRISYRLNESCGAKEIQGLFSKLIDLSKIPATHLTSAEIKNLWKEYLALLVTEKITLPIYATTGKTYQNLIEAQILTPIETLKDHSTFIDKYNSIQTRTQNLNLDANLVKMKPEEFLNYERANQTELLQDLAGETTYHSNILTIYNKK